MQNSPEYNAEFAQNSLLSISAKAWLAQPTSDLCPKCKGEWREPKNIQTEIINGRWELSTHPKSFFGRMAPQNSKIRLIGSFFDNYGAEFISPKKHNRGQQIYDDGWT